MQNILQELMTAYAAIIRSAPDENIAAQHLIAFVDDVARISQSITDAINAAKQRAGGPVSTEPQAGTPVQEAGSVF